MFSSEETVCLEGGMQNDGGNSSSTANGSHNLGEILSHVMPDPANKPARNEVNY